MDKSIGLQINLEIILTEPPDWVNLIALDSKFMITCYNL